MLETNPHFLSFIAMGIWLYLCFCERSTRSVNIASKLVIFTSELRSFQNNNILICQNAFDFCPIESFQEMQKTNHIH